MCMLKITESVTKMHSTGSKSLCTKSGPIIFKHNSHYFVSFYIQMAAYAIPRVMRERERETTVFSSVLYNCNLAV